MRAAESTIFAMAFLNELLAAGKAGSIPQNLAESVFRDVLVDTIESFGKEQQEVDSSKRRKLFDNTEDRYWRRSRRTESDTQEPDLTRAEHLATLLCHCLSLDLGGFALQICDSMMREYTRCNASDFDRAHIPVLLSLARKFRDKEIDLENSDMKDLYRTCLAAYEERAVGLEPLLPADWTHAPVSCRCSDCLELSAFLANPTMKTGRFSKKERTRSHLQRAVSNRGYLFTTEMRGSPYTLVITKTHQSFNNQLKAWRTRVAQAKSHMENMGEANLKILLGDRFDDIWEFTAIKRNDWSRKALGEMRPADAQNAVKQKVSVKESSVSAPAAKGPDASNEVVPKPEVVDLA